MKPRTFFWVLFGLIFSGPLRKRPGLRLPRALFLIVIALVAVAFALLGLEIVRSRSLALSTFGSFALVLTLIVVMIYTYYTYRVAYATCMPSASFDIKQHFPDTEPTQLLFHLMNHSKASLECWCNLGARVCGEAVSLGGFYNARTSFDLLPFQHAHGRTIWIEEFLEKASDNPTVQKMEERAQDCGAKDLVTFRVSFWYNAPDLNFESKPFTQRFYYDFATRRLILDY